MSFPWDVAKSLEFLGNDTDESSKGEAGDTGDAKPVIDGKFRFETSTKVNDLLFLF